MIVWHPIETAPKDGREILLYGCHSFLAIESNQKWVIQSRWDEDDLGGHGWFTPDGVGCGEFSHWAELNAPGQ